MRESSLLKNLDSVAACPEVIGAVVTDHLGALHRSAGTIDAEVGAVLSYSLTSMARAGEIAGLGGLSRIVLTGTKRACIIGVYGDEIVGVLVDASKSVAAFEKRLDDLLQR